MRFQTRLWSNGPTCTPPFCNAKCVSPGTSMPICGWKLLFAYKWMWPSGIIVLKSCVATFCADCRCVANVGLRDDHKITSKEKNNGVLMWITWALKFLSKPCWSDSGNRMWRWTSLPTSFCHMGTQVRAVLCRTVLTSHFAPTACKSVSACQNNRAPTSATAALYV